MVLNVEANIQSSEDARARLAAGLQKRIKQMLGISAFAIVGQPGDVERSQGKAVRVIDKRPKT
jgi:phenylacetate-CoA ligase